MIRRALHIDDDERYIASLRAEARRSQSTELCTICTRDSYEELIASSELYSFDVYILDLTDFWGIDETNLQRLGAALARRNKRVVFWSEAASPDRVPKGCYCFRERRYGGPRQVWEWVEEKRLLPDVGRWVPRPSPVPFAALDILCQGYLAVAGLLEMTTPPPATDPLPLPDWFAPARRAINEAIREQGEADLWPALGTEADPIRALINQLDSSAGSQEEWNQVVLRAHEALRNLAVRGYL